MRKRLGMLAFETDDKRKHALEASRIDSIRWVEGYGTSIYLNSGEQAYQGVTTPFEELVERYNILTSY